MNQTWWPKVKQAIYYIATHYTWAFVLVMAVTLASCPYLLYSVLACCEGFLEASGVGLGESQIGHIRQGRAAP